MSRVSSFRWEINRWIPFVKSIELVVDIEDPKEVIDVVGVGALVLESELGLVAEIEEVGVVIEVVGVGNVGGYLWGAFDYVDLKISISNIN